MNLLHPYRSSDQHSLKDLKNLKGKDKIIYIWDYYKVPIFLILLLFYIVVYSSYRHATAKQPLLYAGFVNVSVGEDLQRALTDDFISSLNLQNKRASVQTYSDLYLSEHASSDDLSYMQASQMKILASIDGELLDVVFMNQEAFDAFSQNGFLMNLEDFLKAGDSDLYQRAEEFLTENIEILSDNSTEVIADSSIPYESEITSYPMGLKLNSYPRFQNAGFPDTVYIGIIRNTPHSETVLTYLNYLISE